MTRLVHQRPKGCEGFTLIEALIALVVVATGMLALAQFHSKVLISSADAKARTEAVMLAQAKMDQLRNFYSENQFSDIQASASPETAADTTTDLGMSGMDWVEDFSRYWTVTTEDIDGDGSVDQKRIRTTVSWTDVRDVHQEIHLESIIQLIRDEHLVAAGQILSSSTGF